MRRRLKVWTFLRRPICYLRQDRYSVRKLVDRWKALDTVARSADKAGGVLGEIDQHLLGEGTHMELWHALGAHVLEHEGQHGTHFAVWAPNAQRVAVVGDFNQWDPERHPLQTLGSTGVWESFVPGIGDGAAYMYDVTGCDGIRRRKADPVGFGAQHPPQQASIVRDIDGYGWHDDKWMDSRGACNRRDAPIAVYEVHLGSWRRRAAEDNRMLSYREAAVELVDYVLELGFTHIEFMPLSEHPFDGSWGYQPVGLFAPTIRHGPAHEFRDLVDAAHQAGLGVIIDWVPGHFPADAHGLALFDGTALYEHADPREGYHPDWNTLIYNFGRVEVSNFLRANALYWMREYHVDGLRVDAVASMLYRDYSREQGEWVPNLHGGRENLEAIEFLRRTNTEVYAAEPDAMTIAEESTSFPGVSQRVDLGGLGFGYKWNMGWMNDTLRYMAEDPLNRKYHHELMTFGLHYAFSENFILPISHDEVVHGKGSMLQRMPGNEWERFANLRAYYGFMWGHPGKKLLFMGCEFGQSGEWRQSAELAWDEASRPQNTGLRCLVRDLNSTYRAQPALHRRDCEHSGFQWLALHEADTSIFAWLRLGDEGDSPVVVVCNFTPVERRDWQCGMPCTGRWRELLNSDAEIYGGSGRGNLGAVLATSAPRHDQPASAAMTLPPLSTLMFVYERDDNVTADASAPEAHSLNRGGNGRPGGSYPAGAAQSSPTVPTK